MTAPLRVLVADDQTIVREGLVMLLGQVADVEVVGVAADGDEAVRLADERRPDVVLIDLRMPRCDGIEATRRLQETHPEIAVVVLTTFADDDSIFGALRAGARGYLTKSAGAGEIVRALTLARAGEAMLDPAVQRRLLDTISMPPSTPVPPSQPRQLPDGLTHREVEVLRLIAGGLSNAEIADQLFLSNATVKTHINHIFSKAGLRDRAQAVHYAYKHGFTDGADGTPSSLA
jgi:DNA-binding NarL/FixJ family response regulator